MMPPDVISHENQLQHLSEPSIFILDVFRTADHAGQIFIPHRPATFHRSGVAKMRARMKQRMWAHTLLIPAPTCRPKPMIKF